jgi:hypothetical protein
MAAREMDILQQQNSDRLQVEGADRIKPGEKEESKVCYIYRSIMDIDSFM